MFHWCCVLRLRWSMADSARSVAGSAEGLKGKGECERPACAIGRDELGASRWLTGGGTSVIDREPAVVVAGQFDGDEAVGCMPTGGVAQMAHLYGHTPIIGERLIEIVGPNDAILTGLSVVLGQGCFKRVIIVNEFVQSVDRAL